MHNNIITISFVTIILSIILGFGISIGVINKNNNNLISDSNICGSFPNVTSFTMRKQFRNQWHWRYNIKEFSGFGVIRCPTNEYDSLIYVDDKIVGYIDGKIFTVENLSYINDCKGNRLYVVKAGNPFRAYINGFNILVSLIIKNNAGDIIGYVDSKYFFTDNINIKNIKGNIVANINKSYLSPNWNFQIYDINDIVSDKLLLSLLATKRSFSDSYNGDGNQYTDSCNTYFVVITILLIICGCTSIFLIGIFIYVYMSSR